MSRLEEAILEASARLAAVERANCLEILVHPTPDGPWYREVAHFYAVETCLGRYVIPFHLHKAPTLWVYCFAKDCPGGGRHAAEVKQVFWDIGRLPLTAPQK